MTTASLALWLVGAPLVAFLGALVLFRERPRAASAVALASGAISVVAAVVLLGLGARAGGLPTVETRWMSLDGADLAFGFLLDGPNLLMGVVVAAIAFLIQIYSTGYMAGDRGWARYFALMAFFAWSMLSFVYSSNLLQMFIFWELVGLASFFLIGFWYEKPAAAAAGRKAFLMTRVGDVGLFLGLIVLWQRTGTLDLVQIVAPETIAALSAGDVTLIGGLLFLGVAGKSAQFPLHTWLPDAMEGPTPVSALLHSATMVAAGVFLFARFLPIFLASQAVTIAVLAIAAFTAILSATVAMVAQDIKRILAYSSISQLSFMLLGLAAGSLDAGFFHLITHAFFKALLFLCAGAYIHRLGSNDAVAIGRAGGRSMRVTTAGLVIGGAALAGVPPFAGFFSKEAILHAVGGTGLPWLVAATYFAVFLTAYYTFRMVFLVLRPNSTQASVPAPTPAPGENGREGPISMILPIGGLAGVAVVAGFAGPWISRVLHGGAGAAHGTAGGFGDPSGWLPAVAILVAGIALAWVEYGRAGASQTGFLTRLPALRTLFVRGWYVDDFYEAVLARAMAGLAKVCAWGERVLLDGTGDRVGDGTRLFGRFSARLQSGQLQVYLGTAILLIAVFGWFVGRNGGTP